MNRISRPVGDYQSMIMIPTFFCCSAPISKNIKYCSGTTGLHTLHICIELDEIFKKEKKAYDSEKWKKTKYT